MINLISLRRHVIRPLLMSCNLWSHAAENLIIGTGLIESEFSFIKQFKGPALGFWQIEPNTYHFMVGCIKRKKEREELILEALEYNRFPKVERLLSDMSLSIIMARYRYLINLEPLPKASDIEGLARYWAKIYNTKNDEDQIGRFVYLYNRHA